MAQQSEGVWVTINGRHVLIKEGETATDAINRSIAKHNEDLKEKQIAQRKAEADERNGKSSVQHSVYSDLSEEMYGKDWFELNREEKTAVVDAYNKHKEQADKSSNKKSMKMDKDYYDKHVDMAVEFEEDDGYRYWEECKGSEVDALIKKRTKYGHTSLSDVDLANKQSDPKVKDFLNFVMYNFDNNPKFKGMSLMDVIDKAFGREFTVPTKPDKKNIFFK